MIVVNWAFNIGNRFRDESLLKNLKIDEDIFCSLAKETNLNRKNVIFKKCPAHTEFTRNTFVFKSPVDINLSVDTKEHGTDIFSDNLSQPLFDRVIDFRFLDPQERGESPYPIVGIDFLNSFTVDRSVTLEVLPAFLHYNDFTSKCTVIPGEFDIHRWVRPVELVFEFNNKKDVVEIKKGDALCYFKFRAGEESIKIKKSIVPWDEIIKCNEIRQSNPWQPLKERYKSYQESKNQ